MLSQNNLATKVYQVKIQYKPTRATFCSFGISTVLLL